jgi:hypothetical protein
MNMKALLLAPACVVFASAVFAGPVKVIDGCEMQQAEGTNVWSKPDGRCDKPRVARPRSGEDRIGLTPDAPDASPEAPGGGDEGPGEGEGGDHGEGPGDGQGEGGEGGDGGDNHRADYCRLRDPNACGVILRACFM